jgi:hypothetical protein
MHDDAGDVPGRQVAGMTLDPDVAEAVRGVPWFEGVATAAGRDDANAWPEARRSSYSALSSSAGHSPRRSASAGKA